ncbi:hypothetical protein RJ640_027848 [Escallonia rubra]|uniref:Uncharacterized protein n=1 Tax=Escallonia rubra TaxID=112253 RepID=A0AA88RMC0_9ASTE|nr:hypothetical protein RJ640_027848 [Escallonia rubra]
MAETICSSLSATEELYNCLDDLLGLPLTQQALSLHQHEEWANELLDGSVRLLDICSAAKEFMSQLREHASDLQSALRRRKGDSSMESSIAKYISFRRKMKKESKRLLAALKQMDNKIGASSLINQDHRLETMIRVLKEVSTRTISIFQSLLLFLSVPISKPKPAKWSMVSKLMHKGAVTCDAEQENVNELESIDAALWSLCRYGSNEGQKMQIAQNRMEELEADIQGFENAISCICSIKRSLPSTLRNEEELKKLKAWEEGSSVPTVDTICNGLSGVEELYKCVDDMLGLPLAEQALSHHHREEWADELLDGSVRLLDICGAARDFMSQLKEHGAVTCEERQNYVHEFETADAVLCSLCRYGSSEVEKMQIAQSKLDVLAGIDGFENHLRSIFRRLVKVEEEERRRQRDAGCCGAALLPLPLQSRLQSSLFWSFGTRVDDATDGGTGELYKIEDIDNTTAVRVILGTPIAVLWTHHRARSQRAVERKVME